MQVEQQTERSFAKSENYNVLSPQQANVNWASQKNNEYPQQKSNKGAAESKHDFNETKCKEIIYYSNYCKHSQKVVQYLVKNGFTDRISFICIDNRKKDTVSGQIYIILQNGNKTLLPPNIHSVPSLLLINDKFRVVTGDDIIDYYKPHQESSFLNTNFNGGEPSAYDFNSGGSCFIKSDKYTFYNTSPEDLGVSGKGGLRQMHNYTKATHDPVYINTPLDDYRPDKISNDLTLEVLEKKRMEEIGSSSSQPKVI